MKFLEINASQIYFLIKDTSGWENFILKIRGVIKFQKKTHLESFFSIFDVKYFFNKRTVALTFKIQWNVTGTLPGKLKKKNLLGFISSISRGTMVIWM